MSDDGVTPTITLYGFIITLDILPTAATPIFLYPPSPPPPLVPNGADSNPASCPALHSQGHLLSSPFSPVQILPVFQPADHPVPIGLSRI